MQRIMIAFIRGIIMVKIHLSKLLGERRMSQRKLSELTGIRPNTINEWYNEIAVSLRVEHIDRICEVLGCSVDELIEVIPNKMPKTGKNLIIEEHGNQKAKKGQ
jgi:putative transcriptional regulator